MISLNDIFMFSLYNLATTGALINTKNQFYAMFYCEKMFGEKSQ